MTRFSVAVRWDFRLQLRNGFYYAAAFVAVMTVLTLWQLNLSKSTLALLLPMLLLENVLINTFYFLAGLMLLEKTEGTLEGVVVSPLRRDEYLTAKLFTLVALSIVENMLIVALVYGRGFNPVWLTVAIILLGTFFALAGFITVVRYDSINSFLLPSVLVTLTLSVPLVDYFGLWQSWLIYFHPVQAQLVLLKAAFEPVALWQIFYGLTYSAVGIGGAYWLSKRAFYRFVILKEGVSSARRPAAHRSRPKAGRRSRTSAFTLINVFRALGPIDWRNIRRDTMLLWMAVMPFLFAALYRFLVPWVRDGLLAQFGFDLAPYYPLLISYGFFIGTPMFYGVVIGFLLLDERDDRTLQALQVTPLPIASYLTYRVAMPIVLSVLLTVVSFPLAGLVSFPLPLVLIVALLAAPLAPIFALFLAALAGNKVQGFAIMKGTGFFLILPLLAYFVPSNWQWLFGLMPTFWPVKLYWTLDSGGSGGLLIFAIGLVYQLILLVTLLGRFRRIMRQ